MIWLSKINPFYECYIFNSFYRQRGIEYAAWAACHSSCSLVAGALPCSISWWTAQKIISCHLCSKIILTVGVNKSKEVCLFQRASCCSRDCPWKCQMETLLSDHSHRCQACVSGGGFSKDGTEQAGNRTAGSCYLLWEHFPPWTSWHWCLNQYKILPPGLAPALLLSWDLYPM